MEQDRAATVLVVEDDKDANRLLAEILQERGMEVLQAFTGPDGLRLALQKQPDLVLLDLMLPFKSGDEVLRHPGAQPERGIEPDLALPPRSLMVQAEATALSRVVRNLVSNALTHSTGGLRVRLEESDGRAVLVVANGAAGARPEEVELIFERFYRADRARTGPHAGLGLSIVKELVAQMHGTVRAELDGQELGIVVELPLAQETGTVGGAA